MRSWRVKAIDCVNTLLHQSHLFGLSLLCVRSWTFKCWDRLMALLYSSHLYGVLPCVYELMIF